MRLPVSHVGPDSRRFLAEDWLAAAVIVGFFLINLIGLDRVPFANADEAWIAEPGLRFWQTGAFASQLHAGFFGTERHYLMHTPLFSIVTGWMIWIFGHGVVQVRIISLAMSALTAGFTYRLGRTLLSPRHGLIAAVILTWCRTGPYQWEARQSGIVLVDFGRYARYDIAVPFFGALGMLLILSWLVRPERPVHARTAAAAPAAATPARPAPRIRLVLTGICAGLAMASHPMGLIWIATLAVACVVAVRAQGRRMIVAAVAPVGWILLGAGIAMMPWIVYALANWEGLIAQQKFVANRWSLDPRFYAWNVVMEWRRYISIGRGLQFGIPGAWLLVMCGVTGLISLVSSARRRDAADVRRDDVHLEEMRLHEERRDKGRLDDVGSRLILVSLITGVLMLTIGDREKFFFYLAAQWPWIAVTVAIGVVIAMQSSSRIIRLGVIVLLALGCVDGIRAEVHLARTAATRTSYATLADRLAAHIPREARVMGLPTWWFALDARVREYRSLTVPMFFLDIEDPTGRTFTERLGAIDADVVLLDQAMLDYIHGPRANWAKGPGTRNPGAEELERFITTHSVRRVDLSDPAYGRFEIHYLQ